jgi:outer membrane lipoprotein-sorting protein
MNLIKYTLILLFVLIINPAIALQNDTNKDIQDILDILDNLKYSNEFSGIYDIAYYSPNKPVSIKKYKMYSKGNDRMILSTLWPERNKGEKILMTGSKLWLYFPKAKKSLVISSGTPLIGNVNIGDVLSPSLREVYDYLGYEITDKDMTYKIALQAKGKEAPYGKVLYYFRDKKLVQIETFARSGLQLNNIQFQDYILNPSGIHYPTKIKVINSIDPRYYSLMKVSDCNYNVKIPDFYFNPEGLDRIQD